MSEKKSLRLEATLEESSYKDKDGVLRTYANVYVMVKGIRLQLQAIDRTSMHILEQALNEVQ